MYRSIIKHTYIRQSPSACGAARAHIRYIRHRPGKDIDNAPHREIFSAKSENIDPYEIYARLDAQPPRGTLIHKMILSPGTEGTDLRAYTRSVMSSLSSYKAQQLEWYAVEHHNTDHPHTHIIILGHDSTGRHVRFTQSDYLLARRTGDDFLHSKDLLQKPKEERPLRRALTALRTTTRSLISSLLPSQLTTEQNTRLPDLGSLPDATTLTARRTRRQSHEESRLEKLWNAYTRPILIRHAPHIPPTTYTWRTSLPELRDLERSYLRNDPTTISSMSPSDLTKLQLWIKHRLSDERRLHHEASSIRALDLTFTDGSSLLIDRTSPSSTLRSVAHMHERNLIYLHDAELRALNTWLRDSRSTPSTNPTDYPRPKLPASIKRHEEHSSSPKPKPLKISPKTPSKDLTKDLWDPF